MLTVTRLFLILLAVTLLLPGRLPRRLGAFGMILAGFAGAAFSARLGTRPMADLVTTARLEGVPPGFLAITTGLLFAGVIVLGIAAVTDLATNAPERRRALIAVVAWGGAAFLAWRDAGPLAVRTGWGATLADGALVTAGIAAVVAILYLARLDRGLAWLDDRLLAPPRPVPPAGWLVLDLVLALTGLLAALVVLLSGRLDLVLAAALILTVAAHLLSWRRGGGTPVPVLPVFAVALVPFGFLALSIAGTGPSLSLLAQGSFSGTAERLIAGLLLVVVVAFAGLWPLHGVVPGRWVLPIGAVLLWRVGVPIVPEGVAHWAPLVFPVVAVSVWRAAARRHLPELFAALAVLSAASVLPPGLTGARWLALACVLFLGLDALEAGSRVVAGLRRLAWLVPAWGMLLAITAGLESQVTYTVVTVLGLCAGVAWSYRELPPRLRAMAPTAGTGGGRSRDRSPPRSSARIVTTSPVTTSSRVGSTQRRRLPLGRQPFRPRSPGLNPTTRCINEPSARSRAATAD